MKPPLKNHPPSDRYWLYGRHAVLAALENPKRLSSRLLLNDAPDLELAAILKKHPNLRIENADKGALQRLLGPHAVHQGIALLTAPLPSLSLEEVAAARTPTSILLILDQITDPHNIGAILRSAAAFNVQAVIVTQRHAPSTLGVVGKAASGGLEKVPMITVTNLARTLEYLKRHDYWCAAMDGAAQQSLEEFSLSAPLALVLGAEGRGLRRLTQESCDFTLRISTSPDFSTLNVSNAAAISLYALRASQRPSAP